MTHIVFEKAGSCMVRFVSEPDQLDKLGLFYIKEIYKPEYLSTFFVPKHDGDSILLVGIGKENPQEANTAKELTGAACREMRKLKISAFTFDMNPYFADSSKDTIRAFSEGIFLVTGKAKTYKTDIEEKTYTIGITGMCEEYKDALEEGRLLAEHILFTRDLVNMPANDLWPEKMAEEIVRFSEGTGIETRIIHADEMEKMGMGGLLGVGKGSIYPPCLLVMRYTGDEQSKERTGLVGKGVTVDTGGYCLKSASSMMGIRGDMAGAAAVAGVICALARRKAKVNVSAVLPMCENRISGGSMVDGDVLTSYSGKTIQIGNTDAEGRLILADAVTYAVRDEKVSRILDSATLTGAVVGMFGFTIAGVLSDSDDMWNEFFEASKKTGEKYWRIPFFREHEKMLESDVADIKNIGGSVCGTITAGLFIREFAEKIPWIHVDIAGTAWVDEPIYAYQEKYATGAGVETIYQWLV